MRGEELPDGLSLPDQMAYTALRNTYRAYYDKTISRDAAAAEKQQIRLACQERLQEGSDAGKCAAALQCDGRPSIA